MAEKMIPLTDERISVDDKKLINCQSVDVNQLIPIKYGWAWDYYLDGCANHWMPQEVSMQRDIEQWKDPKMFSDEERHMFERNLGFFTTADTLIINNIVLSIYKCITNPECRQYLVRQAFEEAVHTHAYQYIPQTLSLDEGRLYNMYREVPVMNEKAEFQAQLTADLCKPDFEMNTIEGKKRFLDNLVGYYVITEGIFFYTAFVMLLSFGRTNRLPGTCEQIQYILRDESMHLNFGLQLINTIVDENPELWTEEIKANVIKKVRKGVDLEVNYGKECLPNGLLGLTHEMLTEYVYHIANRRLEKLGLPAQYDAGNPFPWMSEIIDLRKEKNFFETKVTEYQNAGALEW